MMNLSILDTQTQSCPNSSLATPLVSVIIDNYNYGHFLSDAIDSVLEQTYSNIEIIVVDDGSTDDSKSVIQGYGDRIRPILKANGGQASAFNAGFAASRGEIVCILDADDVMKPDRVERAVAVLQAHPDIGWCYHQLILMDADRTPIHNPQLEAQRRLDGQVYEFDLRHAITQGSLLALPIPLPGIVGLTFRRSHLTQIFPMPEADGISVSDSYVQFVSCTISPGVAFDEGLEVQRIHGKNAFTLQQNRQMTEAKIMIMTAYWLRRNYPETARFANNLVAQGLSHLWKLKTQEFSVKKKGFSNPIVIQDALNTYWKLVTPIEKQQVLFKTAYNAWLPAQQWRSLKSRVLAGWRSRPES